MWKTEKVNISKNWKTIGKYRNLYGIGAVKAKIEGRWCRNTAIKILPDSCHSIAGWSIRCHENIVSILAQAEMFMGTRTNVVHRKPTQKAGYAKIMAIIKRTSSPVRVRSVSVPCLLLISCWLAPRTRLRFSSFISDKKAQPNPFTYAKLAVESAQIPWQVLTTLSVISETRIHDWHIDKVSFQDSISIRTQTYIQTSPNSIRVQCSIYNKINFVI